MSGEQFHFVFPQPDPSLESLLLGREGASAIQVLRLWKAWPKPLMALTGPERSGVSTVLRAWVNEVDGRYLKPDAWTQLGPDQLSELLDRPLALDDVDKVVKSAKLLMFLNLAVENGIAVLIGGHGNPAAWHSKPPDLVSRLSAVTRLVLPDIDDSSFEKRLRAACLRRFIDLPDETLNFVSSRLDRTYQAIEAFADGMNAVMGSEQKPASIPVARRVLNIVNAAQEAEREP